MQVQNTNDSSIVSKLSSSNAGYYDDHWLKMFVAKEQRRSPIINRGYYIRFKAIEAAFRSWLSLTSSKYSTKSQIISLGAGFDSSYLRLKSNDHLPPGCRYIEIDYPEVMKRKLKYIQHSKMDLLNDCDCVSFSNERSTILSWKEYAMIGMDLRNCEDLEKHFKVLSVDFKVPSLFLSECAVTYMDAKDSNALIQWIQNHFTNAAFVAYEQIHPEDGFGIVMQNHFTSLGCPLKSLPFYPTKESQYSRFQDMGWKTCSAITMFDFFMTFSEEEKKRIRFLELFDEFEMWHEKCQHYILLWACQGSIPLPELFKHGLDNVNVVAQSTMSWKYENIPETLQRFGHQTVLLRSRFQVLSGGFGHLEKRHQRLGSLACYDIFSGECATLLVTDHHDLVGKRMYHTMTLLSNNSLVIVGGRSSPSKPYGNVISVSSVDEHQENIMRCTFFVEEKATMPEATWRHSASLVENENVEKIVLFGGRTISTAAINDCYILDTKKWCFFKVPSQKHTPCSRFSHSAVSLDKGKVIVTGGLTADEEILNSVNILDTVNNEWSTLCVSGLLPRYSHTSHFLNDCVVLVGGVTNTSGSSLSLSIINLTSTTAQEILASPTHPEYPIVLSNHCSFLNNGQIVVTGGGGNCFSFGTHFNKKNVIIDIKTLQ